MSAGPGVDRDEAAGVARSFIEAVAWGEHRTVWDLLGPEGRRTVLRVAVTSGMDQELAARLGDGTASAGEMQEFLVELVSGLRADLAGNDLDDLEYDADLQAEDQARVVMSAPIPEMLGPVGLPVGSLELARHDGDWRVERLLPRPGQA